MISIAIYNEAPSKICSISFSSCSCAFPQDQITNDLKSVVACIRVHDPRSVCCPPLGMRVKRTNRTSIRLRHPQSNSSSKNVPNTSLIRPRINPSCQRPHRLKRFPLHQLDVRQPPRLVEQRFLRTVEAEENLELAVGARRNPVRLLARRRLGTEVDVHRTVRVLLESGCLR